MFPILCDTERRVIKDWDIFDPREKGGIAKPAVFVLDRDRTVRHAQVDQVAKRLPPTEIIRVLIDTPAPPLQPKIYIPGWRDFLRALGSRFRP